MTASVRPKSNLSINFVPFTLNAAKPCQLFRCFIPVAILASVLSSNSLFAEEKWDETNPKHPSYKRPEVLKMIDQANYCDIDEDCGNAGPVGPYGCSIPVNVHEAEAMNQKLEPYRTVLYSCKVRELECSEHKCRIVEKESKR